MYLLLSLILGTLRLNDMTVRTMLLKKSVTVLSVLIAITPTHLHCQMYVNPPEV